MVVLSVLYRGDPGARFDGAYYRDVHLPAARARLGAALLSVEVFEPVEPGAAVRVMALLRFASAEAMAAALAGGAMAKLVADIPTFTDIVPEIQANTTWRLPTVRPELHDHL